jgi:hypothetical protein
MIRLKSCIHPLWRGIGSSKRPKIEFGRMCLKCKKPEFKVLEFDRSDRFRRHNIHAGYLRIIEGKAVSRNIID